jgi:hypothetical protein
MRPVSRLLLGFLAAIATVATACHPAPMLARFPGLSGSDPTRGGAAPEPVGNGGLNVAIRWPQRAARGVQSIPGTANTLVLAVRKRDGTLVTPYTYFNRPASNQSITATASVPVKIGNNLVVQVNAYRENFSTDPQLPTADHIIGQGNQENVTITLNATTSLTLNIDPEITVAGIGGTPALGAPPPITSTVPPDGSIPDARGNAIWTELVNPDHLRYDPVTRYLYFTEDPDPSRLTEGLRVARVSFNPNIATSSQTYGLMTLIAGGANGVNRDPDAAGPLETAFNNPQGIAIDANDNIYLAESGRNRIRMISTGNNTSPYGWTMQTIAGNGSSQGFLAATVSTGVNASFNGPRGLLYVSTGSVQALYVADTGNNAVRRIDLNQPGYPVSTPTVAATSSQTVTQFNLGIYGPAALAFDGNRTVYVAGGNVNGQIGSFDIVTNVGRVITSGVPNGGAVGSTIAYLSTFGVLSGIAYNSTNGALYLADPTNNAVWSLTNSAGLYETTAPGLLVGQPGLGAGNDFSQSAIFSTTARLNQPRGLLIDRSSLYICDAGNNRIRRLDLTLPPASPSLYPFQGNYTGLGGMQDATPAIDPRQAFGTNQALFSQPSLIARAADPFSNLGYLVLDSLTSRLRLCLSNAVVTVAGYANVSRLTRGTVGSSTYANGGDARQLHLPAIADIALERRLGQPGPTNNLDILVSDSNLPGEAVIQVSGLTQVPVTDSNFFFAQPITNLNGTVLFENLSGDVLQGFRVLNVPRSLAYGPFGNLVFSVTGGPHQIWQWTGAREVGESNGALILKTNGDIVGQGIQLVAGAGARGYNVEGDPRLIQIDTARNMRYDANGNLYFFCNNGAGATVVRKITATTPPRILTIAGGGGAAVPSITGSDPPLPATQANLNNPADMDVDSQGNIFVASGTQIYRFDPQAETLVMIYDTQTRTFRSIAYSEPDQAMFFTFTQEPKVKKIYFPRVF